MGRRQKNMEQWMSEIDYRLATGVEDKEQYHIKCSRGDVAPIVLVPGDPGRVLTIAEHLEHSKKVADNRGLVTYTGEYKGVPVSVTSSGMGGPSAAIVYEELINIGAQYVVRVGSVAALQREIDPGDLSIPYACIRDDGVSEYYVPENYPATADPHLYLALLETAQEKNVKYWTGINWTHSTFYARSKEYFRRWSRKNVVTMEMEAATLMVIGTLRGVKTAFIGTVFENRIRQTEGGTMDLSVKSAKKERVREGVRASIEIALQGTVKAFRSDEGSHG
jgi:uridine phosphorylase